MRHIDNCSRCMMTIAEERRRQHPVICNSCGHVATDNEVVVEEKLEKSFMRWVIGASVVGVLAFMQVANWGDHAIEASYLQIGEWTRVTTRSSSERMAHICYDLKKWDCVETVYARLTTGGTTEDQYRYSKFLMSRAKYKPAAEAFRKYFASGGNDLDATYLFARALAESGQIDEASKHFETVLAAKPGILQITVVQNYVKYLVAANQLGQAKRVIQKVRSQGDTVSQFMDGELQEISARLATSRS